MTKWDVVALASILCLMLPAFLAGPIVVLGLLSAYGRR